MIPFVVLNPSAGSADAAAVSEALAHLPGAFIAATDDESDVPRMVSEAARRGFDVVVAAGGDGTVNRVAAGLAALPAPPRLGLLPLGTGNDLARTLGIPLDLQEAVAALLAERVRPLDVVDVEADDGADALAVNVSAGGFSGEVGEVLTSESKRRWGPLAYVWSALLVAPQIEPYRTRLVWENGAAEEIEVLNLIVANGRTVAGGRAVAPRANPEDGLLDVVVVRYGSALDLARVGARLLAGDYLEDELVTMRRARAVRVSSEPSMPWNADGELVTRATTSFSVRQHALQVLVGPDYRPEP